MTTRIPYQQRETIEVTELASVAPSVLMAEARLKPAPKTL
jgi:hypothetical protein